MRSQILNSFVIFAVCLGLAGCVQNKPKPRVEPYPIVKDSSKQPPKKTKRIKKKQNASKQDSTKKPIAQNSEKRWVVDIDSLKREEPPATEKKPKVDNGTPRKYTVPIE
ncbi:hypothetical protein [Campylobacter sp. JMF_08 NE1]|uniref:hypothetical protein n=1 Tax=Campylobacter sp. JMF_08 NE1 TaxID=2983821 RepID=UPI0022E9BD7F|nr:hypothetical protein [Campylobacter sp. JMF_08 NE1]MDA3047393.1 hypothetical protein [Campylobacter sp. JMF_08 NE1]